MGDAIQRLVGGAEIRKAIWGGSGGKLDSRTIVQPE